MATRRTFVTGAAAVGIAALTYAPIGRGVEEVAAPPARVPLKRRPRIKSVIRRDDTIVRLGGDSQVCGMTWLSDDRQFLALGDSGGWGDDVKDHYCSSRLFSMKGGPHDAKFEVVDSYPEYPIWRWLNGGAAPYYGLNIIAVDDHIYQFLSSWDPPFNVNKKDGWPENNDWHWNCAKLIYSPDNGRTWHNQDGSTPVVHESQMDQTNKSMLFYKEPQNVFGSFSFVQMGRGYRDNKDGYVYAYAPNGDEGTRSNELTMFRVPRERLLDRSAYEYFYGLGVNGEGTWTKDILARAAAHTFPKQAGGISVTYNAPLGLYMMANIAIDAQCPDGICRVDSKPSYFGLWVSERPWGPWKQIHEDLAWTPGGDLKSRAGTPMIVPQWIAEDGRSFWLVWCDAEYTGLESERADDVGVEHDHDETDFIDARVRFRRNRPYYAMNTQRFDLVLA